MQVTSMSRVRVLHAVANAPAVDVIFDRSAAVATPYSITGLAFGRISRYVPIAPGLRGLKLFAQGAEVVDAQLSEALRPGDDYTVALAGRAPGIRVVLVPDTTAAPMPGMAKMRALHASPDAPALDVAVPGEPALFAGLRFGESTMFTEVPAGTVAVELRPQSEMAPIYSIPTMTINPGTYYTLVAMGMLRGAPPLRVISIADVVRAPVPA